MQTWKNLHCFFSTLRMFIHAPDVASVETRSQICGLVSVNWIWVHVKVPYVLSDLERDQLYDLWGRRELHTLRRTEMVHGLTFRRGELLLTVGLVRSGCSCRPLTQASESQREDFRSDPKLLFSCFLSYQLQSHPQALGLSEGLAKNESLNVWLFLVYPVGCHIDWGTCVNCVTNCPG